MRRTGPDHLPGPVNQESAAKGFGCFVFGLLLALCVGAFFFWPLWIVVGVVVVLIVVKL